MKTGSAWARALEDARRSLIESALQDNGRSPSKAARKLGISRGYLTRRMMELGIRRRPEVAK